MLFTANTNIEVERNHYGKNAEEKPTKCEKVNVKEKPKKKIVQKLKY